jgi:hypothetical protein
MTTEYASRLRMVIRAALVCTTAFGLDLTGDQVAAVQLLGEAVLQLLVRGRK